jgi:hypothetical protein
MNDPTDPNTFARLRPLHGLRVVVSDHAVVRYWEYPTERFWEYIPSPETERWCRFFG